MDIQQIKEIATTIKMAYPQATRETSLVDLVKFYSKILGDQEYEVVFSNLKEHILKSEYPPKVSDLVKKQPKSVIPTHEETMKYLDSLEPKAKDKPSKEEIKEMARKAGLNV